MCYFCTPSVLPLYAIIEYDIIIIYVAVACSKGWHSDAAGEKCLICPKDHYQDIPAQIFCKSCPEGTHTIGIGAVSLDDCIEICTVPPIPFGSAFPPSGYEVYFSYPYYMFCGTHLFVQIQLLTFLHPLLIIPKSGPCWRGYVNLV